nr:GGDEF domain-containing protein [Desulfosporosinus sp. BG]
MQYNIEKLEWISRSDPLTGLYNRRYIMEKIESEFISTKKNAKKFSLILADIDFFKKINDTFGHDCGDHVLKVVSKSLKDAVREQDFVSRWGGEEFLILLPETEIEGARILVDRIKRIIEEQIIEYNGVQVSTTMTFGVTESQDYGMIEDIIKRADNALYEGKSRGRSCIILA